MRHLLSGCEVGEGWAPSTCVCVRAGNQWRPPEVRPWKRRGQWTRVSFAYYDHLQLTPEVNTTIIGFARWGRTSSMLVSPPITRLCLVCAQITSGSPSDSSSFFVSGREERGRNAVEIIRLYSKQTANQMVLE